VRERATKEPAGEETTFVRDMCVKEGLLFEQGGSYRNRMHLIPPLNIERVVLDRALGVLDDVFGAAEKKFGINPDGPFPKKEQ